VAIAQQYLAAAVPALDKTYTSGWFTIHYTTTGTHAVSATDENRNGIPDYIESIASSFNLVKSIVCTTRGFRTPILESGQSTYHVYVYDLGGDYGVTYRAAPYSGNTCASYICIDNDYAHLTSGIGRDDAMKVTAAHEFFHAVQYAYNYQASKWWKEASATWNEDEIYDSINDYTQYLKYVFNAPYLYFPLDYETDIYPNVLHEYGEVIFAMYISEKWGGYSTIRKIWERQAISGYTNSLDAINKVIKDNYPGKSLETIFKRFTACNFRPVQYYSDYSSSSWPSKPSLKNMWSSYPVSTQNDTVDHLACHYVSFIPPSSTVDKVLKLTVDGEDYIKWGFKIQRQKRSDNWCDTMEISMDGTTNRAEVFLYMFGKTYKEICLIPANLERSGSATYSYSANIQ